MCLSPREGSGCCGGSLVDQDLMAWEQVPRGIATALCWPTPVPSFSSISFYTVCHFHDHHEHYLLCTRHWEWSALMMHSFILNLLDDIRR